jgi:hypothetical protein
MAEGIPTGYQKGPGLLHRQICTDSEVYRWGFRRGYSFSLGLHNTVFWAEICVIKACVMADMERGYTGRNIYLLFDSRSAVKGLDNFQVNSELVWYCHQSI